MSDSKMTRRQFLKLSSRLIVVGGAAALIEACGRALGIANPTPTEGGSSLPGVGSGQGAPPPPVASNGQVAVTSNADFYTVASNSEAPPMPADWKLGFGGNVDHPLTFTLDELMALPVVEEMRTLECISNPAGGPLISNAVWKGFKFKELLSRAGIRAGTVELKFESFDGYTTSIPLELAQDDHSLLVYEMNGEPLPIEHGKPLRCLWPGRYGMKQPKWLTTITAVTGHYSGFWESQGWSNDAFILPNSRIDAPADNSTVTTPALEMHGVGFSGAAGVAKIEISTDYGKTWQPAELVRGPTPYVWTNWTWQGSTPADGQYSLLARVSDNKGSTQTQAGVSLLGGTFPNGTADMQPIVITVKKG